MANVTPRKARRGHQNPSAQTHPVAIQTSDYDSEAFFESNVPSRSNTELNLSVLRRYRPSIQTILSIAPSAQIYTYSPSTTSWLKTDTEGTLFVCQLSPASAGAAANYCIVVLNRRGLENLMLDLSTVENVEITDEFLMVGVKGDGEEGMKMLGFFIHADKSDTREVNCRLIREKWEEVNAKDTGENMQSSERNGRRLSLSDLFGGQIIRG
ncbi:PH [Glarea lozoyensis ATCC 20868]|uniref:PH n=1 Tax=Glarea lozoyensis (strain ATCC 20868 / MF5171) TaxID=1116229 RepID=S3DKY1_GLAL2|nr:PH [Glarea lozoyensis ATCC 20868]EPE27213.1 PH [Glarea lozoyensis ATCC 20868]